METIGDYEYNPKDVLGSGWFGKVYKGRSKKDSSSTVAIKTVKVKRKGKNASKIDAEKAIMKQIHDENVVALFDWYKQEKRVFFVMEYCNGGDLKTYLHHQRKKILSENTIRLFLIQLADGMKALYDNGIIHRDLKPKNILITSDVPYPQPFQMKLKIADFGLSRFLEDDEMCGTRCGTPFYMAPEVFRKKQYDAKADLWSLGAIVFKCLIGKRSFHYRHLFARDREGEIMNRHGASSKLTDLLTRMLKHDQNQRINFDQFYHHEFWREPITQRLNDQIKIPLVSQQLDHHFWVPCVNEQWREPVDLHFSMHFWEL